MDSLLVSSVVVRRDWSHLPNDLLLPILQRREIRYLLFSAVVSTSWRSAVAELRRLRLPSRPTTPWLVIFCKEGKGLRHPSAGEFYSLSDDKVYTIFLPDPLIRWRYCMGSSHGWLITCDGGGEFQLLNPITRVQIDLPLASTLSAFIPFWKNDVRLYMKAVLSSSPSEGGNYIVFIIRLPGWDISFARAGERKWTTLPPPKKKRSFYRDCVFHQGQLYALAEKARVEVWDLEDKNWESQQPKIIELPSEGIVSNLHYQFPYLVWTPWGDLLQVWRNGRREGDELSFKVYKMDLERQRLVEVESIGDHALFLGRNQSLCLSCKELPVLKSNSVYFTEECRTWWLNERCDVGVYSLEDATFQPICPYSPRLGWSLSIWLKPRF